MKDTDVTLTYVRDTDLDIRELEDTLTWKRNQQAAARLRGVGFEVRMESEQAGKFKYILVCNPNEADGPHVWATAKEARHLADIAANLTPEEAWKRWLPSVEGFEDLTYTRADALADMLAERTEAQQMYDAGAIDGEMLSVMHRNAASALENVTQAASVLGRKGGSVTGGIKAQKSAENGKLGGRPKKQAE